MQNTPAPARLASRVERGRSGSVRGEEKKKCGTSTTEWTSSSCLCQYAALPTVSLFDSPSRRLLFCCPRARSFAELSSLYSPHPLATSSSMKLRPLLSGQSRRPSGARRLHVVALCGGQRTPCFRRKVKGEKREQWSGAASPTTGPWGEKSPRTLLPIAPPVWGILFQITGTW